MNQPITQLVLRAKIIFSFLVILLLLSFTSSLYLGLETGKVQNYVYKPLANAENAMKTYVSEAQKSPSITPFPTGNEYPIDEEVTDTPAPTDTVSNQDSQSTTVQTQPNVPYVYPTDIPYPQYSLPTYAPFPTPKPGELGSQQWLDQFNKDYQSAQDQYNQAVKNQQQFCNDHPDLCK